MCFYRTCFVFTLSHWAVCARWAPRWKEEHHDVCRHLESYSSAFRLSVFCLFSAFGSCLQARTQLRSSTCSMTARSSRSMALMRAPWCWRAPSASECGRFGHVCNEAPGHFSAFIDWSSSSKPSWGSGWLSPLLMIWRPGRPEHKKVWWHEARLDRNISLPCVGGQGMARCPTGLCFGQFGSAKVSVGRPTAKTWGNNAFCVFGPWLVSLGIFLECWNAGCSEYPRNGWCWLCFQRLPFHLKGNLTYELQYSSWPIFLKTLAMQAHAPYPHRTWTPNNAWKSHASKNGMTACWPWNRRSQMLKAWLSAALHGARGGFGAFIAMLSLYVDFR